MFNTNVVSKPVHNHIEQYKLFVIELSKDFN